MAKRTWRIKSGTWVIIGVVAIFIFALISDWWKTHSVIGWTVLAVLIIGFAFSLYKYPKFRNLVFERATSAAKKTFTEKKASPREPVPNAERQFVLARSKQRCENPDCYNEVKPHIHHIDNDYENQNLSNLIMLCPNHHTEAHQDKWGNRILHNWVSRKQAAYEQNNPEEFALLQSRCGKKRKL